jgi:hypothetical protein
VRPAYFLIATCGFLKEPALMKKIEAIIKPFKLDEVKEALQESASRA